MGCAVNGPGEAGNADLGIFLGRGRAHFYNKGELIRTVPTEEIVGAVIEMIENWEEAPVQAEEQV
jgi:(E)-4-hydroxy-3-methylbut-2-enyl-diphosphate synthase